MAASRLVRIVCVAVALAGCEEAGVRPGFMARLQEDCAAGDADACGILAAPATVPEPRIVRRLRPSANQAERNAAAILQGVDRARAGPHETLTVSPRDTQG